MGGAETFDRECEFEGLDEAKLCFEHGETIGRITKAESTDDGLHITARISDTARGRDAMTLIRDGVLDSFSVGLSRSNRRRTATASPTAARSVCLRPAS